MRELDNLSLSATPKDALLKTFSELAEYPTCFVVFSGVTTRIGHDHTPRRDSENYGLAFKTFLEEHGLGTVIQSEERINNTTKNGVTVWIWHVDNPKLEKWGVANGFAQVRNDMGFLEWYQELNLNL